MSNNGTVAVAASDPSTVLWRLPTPLVPHTFVPFTQAVASPKNGLVFLASSLFGHDNGVAALRRRTVGGRWRTEAMADPELPPSPVVVQAVDAHTGKERWRASFPSAVSSLVTVEVLGASQERIAVNYYTSTDVVVVQLSASSGEVITNISLRLWPLVTYALFLGMADATGDLALVAHRNDIIAFDTASGDERWRLAAPHEPYADIGHGRALITAWDKRFSIVSAIMINATTGAVLWEKPSVGEVYQVVLEPTALPATTGVWQ